MKAYCGKRALDFLAAGAACAVFAPAAAAVSVATWLEDGGSPLFLQARVGQRRQLFTLVKFRSMREQNVSQVGRWLRRTGIDEWPQFLNVYRGEMSLVGPRPLTAADVARLGWTGHDADWRFDIRPGITGLSQLFAERGARHSLRLDRLYLRRQSLSLDLQLLALSLAVNVLGKTPVRRLMRVARRARQRCAEAQLGAA